MGHGRSLPFASASIIHSEIHVILVSSTGLGERTEGSNYSGSQHADKHIWHLISELCESPEWSLDEALLEFTQHRGDLAALLQPRPKFVPTSSSAQFQPEQRWETQQRHGQELQGTERWQAIRSMGIRNLAWISEENALHAISVWQVQQQGLPV